PSRLMVSPSRVTPDPVSDELLRVGYYPTAPQRKISGVELTDAQYDRYSAVAGRVAKQLVSQYMRGDGWGSLPTHVRQDMIREAFTTARAQARSDAIMQSI